MRVFIPSLVSMAERRVALVPSMIERFQSLGLSVQIERGAGWAAGFADDAYGDCLTGADAIESADLVLTLGGLPHATRLRRGTLVFGLIRPWANVDLANSFMKSGVTSFALEYLPRISRAQAMDALSSQATCAGYRAAILGASTSGRLFPLLTTAAGTYRPADVLVIGAGVAGLQAIATARRLGAQVTGYDIRAEAREQIRSLGAGVVESGVEAATEKGYSRELTAAEQAAERQRLCERIRGADIVIGAAFVPGRPAPRLITEEDVSAMRPGSVIVDLAASEGGNCALSHPGETHDHQGIKILAPLSPASDLPLHASEMYCRNLWQFLKPILANGELAINWSDPVYRETLWTHEGKMRAWGDPPLTLSGKSPS
ncbi:nicotinamide nucleotide transhydrogenase, subunit alpha 1 (A1) [mine drainage metagenome]|uniref:proton-translocating NAD(P)(+) transhydrogenase n=1 Tax=mine drainage metagenome TaxID=410659 RepID=T0ZUR6_9ZZZZ